MKNKLPIIILSIALLISLGGNVYLILNQSALNNQLTEVQNRVTDDNNQIAALKGQIADYESLQSQFADLQEQLSQKEEQITTLESTMADLEKQIEENSYLFEAKALWSDNNLSEELECNEETFNETYMGLRESGKTPDEAYAEATEMFKPTPQPQPQQPAEQKPQQQQPSEQKPAEQKPAEQPQQPSNDGYDHAPTNQPGGMPAGSGGTRDNSLTEDVIPGTLGVGSFE